MTLDGLANARGRGTLFHVFSGVSSGMALRCLYGQCCGHFRFLVQFVSVMLVAK